MTHGFFGDAPEALRQPLYAAATILIRRLTAAEPARAATALAYLAEAAPEEAAVANAVDEDALSDALDEAMRRLRGELKSAPIAAMLAARPRPAPKGETATPEQARSRRLRAHRLTGFALIAILFRHRIDPLENGIREAANETRLIKLQDPDLLDALPIEGADMATVRARLAEVLAEAEAREAELAPAIRRKDAGEAVAAGHRAARRIRNRLGPIETLLRACLDARPPITRAYRGRRQTLRAPLAYGRWGEDFERVIDIVEQESDADAHSLAAPAAAEQADAPAERDHVSRTADVAVFDDLADDRRKTRMAARAEATRALALPADYEALTDHEARMLVAASRAAPEDAALQLALAMLVFGRSDRRLAEIAPPAETARPAGADAPVETARWRMLHGRLHLALQVPLPDCVADADLLGRFAPSAPDDETLLLIAPPWLSDRSLRHPPGTGALTQGLARLRDRVARPYSRGRLAAHKQLWLRRAGVDAAAIGVLCGLDPRQTAPMHYTVLPAADLVALHERYLSEALGAPALALTPTRGMIGSRVRPDPALVRAVASTLAGRLSTRLSPGARVEEVAAAHDAFVCHTLLTLMLATGHRPVGAPFEQLGDFDLESGLVWISDKRTRAGRASRVAMLPAAALTQLRAYLAHLQALDARLLPHRPDTVRGHLRPALTVDGAGPRRALFFFLDAAGGVVPASVAAMGDRLERILPLQLNWPRHALRSRLAAAGAGAQAVDALLGHGSADEAPLGRHSALGIEDLRALSDHAAATLAHFGLSVVESPL